MKLLLGENLILEILDDVRFAGIGEASKCGAFCLTVKFGPKELFGDIFLRGKLRDGKDVV